MSAGSAGAGGLERPPGPGPTWRALGALVLPRGTAEIALLASFQLLFLIVGLFLVFHSTVIDNPTVDYDIYFDFDNPNYMQELFRLGGIAFFKPGHPLINLVLLPVELAAELAAALGGELARAAVVVWFTSLAVATSILLVFRYLRDILRLATRRSLGLAVLFGVFANSLLTSVTPESYPFSMLLLTVIVYHASRCLQQERRIPESQVFALTVLTGGITVTNAVKALLPVLFFRELPLRERVGRAVLLMSYFVGVVLLCSVVLVLVTSAVTDGAEVVGEYIRKFTEFQDDERIREMYRLSFLQSAVVRFWGAPLVFPALSTTPFFSHVSYSQLNIVPYAHAWQYGLIALLFLLCAAAVLRNRRTRLVQLLALFFAVDVLIHLVVGWGLQSAGIYGGHWTFLVPMLLGWLYTSLGDARWRRGLDVVLGATLVVVVGTNFPALAEFIEFALVYYPR